MTLSTDQKTGGSSPSERAQLTGPLPARQRAFLSLWEPHAHVSRRTAHGSSTQPPPLVALQQMSVHVLGDSDAGVPEHLGNHMQRRALGQHQRGPRVLGAYACRVGDGDVEALVLMANLADEIDTAIAGAVKGLLGCGYSRAEIGAWLGITRQAAQQRWGANSPLRLGFPPRAAKATHRDSSDLHGSRRAYALARTRIRSS